MARRIPIGEKTGDRMSEPGLFAYAALLLWVPLSIAAVLVMRPERAALFVIMGGLLFLPEATAFKLPFVPPLGKWNIPYLCVWFACLFKCPLRVLRPVRERWVSLAALAILAGGVGTALTNQDSLTYGPLTLPGLTLKDGMSSAVGWLLSAVLPFYLGAVLIRRRDDLVRLVTFLVGAGLVYSLFALVEVRMAPVLNFWVYGFEQHSFAQTLRWGGYRPVVFMAHGLAVALFFVVTAVAAAALVRTKQRVLRIGPKIAIGFLAVVLVACKSAGAVLYGLVAVPIGLFARPRTQARFAAVLGIFVLAYPVLRGADLLPTERAVAAASALNDERAESLAYRLRNEEMVLKKWRERPWFGWGEYGRSRTYNDDGETGSAMDGAWIISLGNGGVVGFAAVFGLLLAPVFLTTRRWRKLKDRDDRILVACLTLIVAVTSIDLIPNGMFSNYPFFISGALLTLSRTLAQAPAPPEPQPTDGAPERAADDLTARAS
jgi:hypothetical protein